MAKKTIATEADHAAAARLVLRGLANGEQLDDVFATLRPYAECRFAFPGDELTEIAAAALEIAGASRATPLSLTDATERHLVERQASGNTAKQKHRAALQAAIALHAGVVVDYWEVAGWWRVQDFTFHAFEAAVVLIRVAAEQSGRSVASVCEEIAARRGVDLDHANRAENHLA
ncbi:MAG TPA: hypothetical protein VIK61_09990 [Acidimicrobiia bacterium]